MEYVKLGARCPLVSRLCFGSLTVGPLQSGMSVGEGAAVIAHAVSRGVNFIDTAQYYQTYPYIREAVKLSGRDDLVIASKTYAVTAGEAMSAVDEARSALGRDTIDIFLLHEQESAETLRGHKSAADKLFSLRESGVIGAVGVSTHRIACVNAVCDLKRRCIWDFDVLHPLYNIAGLGIADGGAAEMGVAISGAASLGIGVYVMKALGGGNLIASAADALGFVTANPDVASAAVGMQSIEEVDANIAFFETGAFPLNGAESLSGNRTLHIEEFCIGCGACVTRCAQNALVIKNSRAYCDQSRCILCGYCAGVCPEFAVRVL